jgi:hypothetical protein
LKGPSLISGTYKEIRICASPSPWGREKYQPFLCGGINMKRGVRKMVKLKKSKNEKDKVFKGKMTAKMAKIKAKRVCEE